MAAMPKDASLRDLVLEQVRSAGEEYVAAEEALERSRLRRDHLILEASEMGFTRRDVAEAARVTVGRVQQIVNGSRQTLPKNATVGPRGEGGCPHCHGRIIPQGGNWRCVNCGWVT